jgi:hypothetical protein
MMLRIIAGLLPSRSCAAVPVVGVARRMRDVWHRGRSRRSRKRAVAGAQSHPSPRFATSGRSHCDRGARTDLGMIGSNETFFRWSAGAVQAERRRERRTARSKRDDVAGAPLAVVPAAEPWRAIRRRGPKQYASLPAAQSCRGPSAPCSQNRPSTESSSSWPRAIAAGEVSRRWTPGQQCQGRGAESR